ncbi:MAG: hypothetical protein CVV33_02250 [Methanomicrobiales archaeon HGW-Methanomicrobiales-4]|nr:MAG: hypothetical protein CVV33_02250 [Methanomicrobiales archaeon HGW-Methanomicrobiales-4]
MSINARETTSILFFWFKQGTGLDITIIPCIRVKKRFRANRIVCTIIYSSKDFSEVLTSAKT